MTNRPSVGTAIAICGNIASGKSTVVQATSNRMGYKVVSFGSLVRTRAVERGLNDSRRTLQDLGYQLFVGLGPAGLLQAAIEHAGVRPGEAAVFDGIRDRSVLDALRGIAQTPVAFFLEVDGHRRYRRFVTKGSGGSVMPYEEFLAIDQHPIEAGIEGLADVADLIVDASLPLEDVVKRIFQYLQDSGFLLG